MAGEVKPKIKFSYKELPDYQPDMVKKGRHHMRGDGRRKRIVRKIWADNFSGMNYKP